MTLAILLVLRIAWTIYVNGVRENKATGLAALAGSIVDPSFLLGCVLGCAAAYFITARLIDRG